MTSKARHWFSVALGVAAMSVGTAFAQAPADTAAPMEAPRMRAAQPPASDAVALRSAQMAAQQAQAKLNGPPPDALVLARAAKSKNVEVARQVLLRNGYTPQQLEGAAIVLEDKTGGSPITPESRINITIEASCCPVKIVITIRL